MNMILDIYKKALAVLAKKPFKLWGISLLGILLAAIGNALGGPVVGIGLAVAVLLETALAIIFLKGYLGEEIYAKNLFACFKDWNTIGRVLGGMGWMYLWIFIWALIPVVGIIFAAIRVYEYRLTPYILMNEPEVGITDAIKVSKERTMGYKGKMFWADVLWVIAAVIVFAILACMSAVRYIGVIFGIINMLFVIAVCVLEPLFAGLIQAAFYVEIEKKRIGSPFYEEIPEKAENKCPSCGKVINDNDMFCSGCGTKLGGDESAESTENAESAESTESTENKEE